MALSPTLRKATHQQTKSHNSGLVLKTIFDHGQISRADVARLTHLTRVTVSEIVADLIERGLVAEVGRGPSTGGKTPILLSVVDDSRHLIAIDLAEDEFRGAIVNLRGALCHKIHLPLNNKDGDQALEMVYELVSSLQAATDKPLLGIGIGTPGLIDTVNGVVLRAVNLSWQDLPLGSLLSQRFELPVYLANDSQVIALAEYIFGDCIDTGSLVVIKFGRGVGSGIVLNHALYQGEGFGAGEIGHLRMVENGLRCRCGNTGCLETVVTSGALLEQARRLLPGDRGSLLNQMAASPETLTFEMLLSAYRSNDALAQGVIERAAQALGSAIAALVSILNVRHILLAGDLVALGEPWLQLVRNEARQRSLSALAEQVEIRYSCLGSNQILLGASALLLTHELGLSFNRYERAPRAE
jgi:predicted NBD/HSP70 family sugar kinase